MIIPIKCFTCGKVIADKYNYFLKELPVEWIHRDDSKLNLLTDTFKMFYNLIKIKKNFI